MRSHEGVLAVFGLHVGGGLFVLFGASDPVLVKIECLAEHEESCKHGYNTVGDS